MTVASVLLLLRQNNLPFGDQTAAADTIESAFRQAFKALCPDCAKGFEPDQYGDHVLETIQGHPSWGRTCQAFPLRRLTALTSHLHSSERE